MSQKHSNISIFVPHIGCPNKCSFCNQRHITGASIAPRVDDIVKAVRTAAKSKNYCPESTEIAFFGGSFTAINRNYMLELLKTASVFVRNKIVSGIRISTRPDAINKEILEILKQYGVTAIELGAQSMDNTVLRKNNRGHLAKDIVNSSKLIKEYGFSLGLQIMTGLFSDTEDKALKTVNEVITLKPDTVRIYPTIVLKDTDLAALFYDNKYKPQTLEGAVELCSKMLLMFSEAGINVIRLGLHTINQNAYVAGPWHPAFSELCQSKIFFENAKKQMGDAGDYDIYVEPTAISKMIGQKKDNINKLKELGFNVTVKPMDTLLEYQVLVERRG